MANATARDPFAKYCVLGIGDICEETPEELFSHVRSQFVCALGVVILVLLTGHILHMNRLSAVPESLVTVLWGAVLGVILWAAPFEGHEYTLDNSFVSLLMKWLLNLVALPIIIFEAGWSLRLRDFVSQLGYIMLFAIVGTIVSIIVVAFLTHWTAGWHGIESWQAAFAYASLISSVDPVSTLATFNQLNVDPLLFILVFGESQINDAVAITLFEAFNAGSLEEPIRLVGLMAVNLLGSIAIGSALAIAYILTLRFTRMGQSPAQAILLVFVSCFFTFSIAEIVGMSGIIAVLFNSIMMGAYTGPHLSTEGMALCSFLLKQMSSLADSLIFIFVGILAVFIVADQGRGVLFGVIMSVVCLIGRFMSIVPLGLLSNAIKLIVGRRLPKERQHMISWKHMFMMWHSGLRGGISIVLVMELGDWANKDTKKTMVNGTFVLVVLYLLVFGSSAGTALRCLGLPLGDQVPEGQTLYDCEDKHGCGWRAWKGMRKRVMLPLLVGSAVAPPTPSCKDVDSDDPEAAHSKMVRQGTDSSLGAPPRASTLGRRASVGNIGLAEIVQDAEEAERQMEFGALHRRHSVTMGTDFFRRSSILTLFGSEDPAHVDARQHIKQEMAEHRRPPAATRHSCPALPEPGATQEASTCGVRTSLSTISSSRCDGSTLSLPAATGQATHVATASC